MSSRSAVVRRPRAARDKLTAAEVAFVEQMGLYFQQQGGARIGGRILGLLMLTADPISLADLAKRLGVARASVSTNIRQLIAAGICEHALVPGERRHFYRYADDAWSTHLDRMLQSLERLHEIITGTLPAISRQHGHTRHRLEDTAAYLAFSHREIAATRQRWRTQSRKGKL